MRMSLTKFTLIFALASALIMSGLILQWHANGKIVGYERMLGLSGLSVYDIGMITGTMDWWIITKAQLLDPISYILITAGIVAYGFILSTRALFIRKLSQQPSSIKQSQKNFKKTNNSQDLDKSREIEQLKSKITKYEKKLIMSNNRINNLKENMDYLVNIINQLQEKHIPIATIKAKKR